MEPPTTKMPRVRMDEESTGTLNSLRQWATENESRFKILSNGVEMMEGSDLDAKAMPLLKRWKLLVCGSGKEA